MMVPDRKAAAEFFAKLANTRYRWPILTAEEKADLIAEFKGFLAQRSQKLSKPWREQLGQMGKAAQPLMFVYLEDVAQTVWSTLYALLSGQSVRLSGGFVRVWWLKGRNIVVGLDPYEDEDDVSGGSLSGLSQLGIKEFYQLVEQHPFPFAQCR